MTKHQIIRALRQDIKKLNRVIDHKIMTGASYYAESRRHKFLMSQLNRLLSERTSWLGRTLSSVSMFMF